MGGVRREHDMLVVVFMGKGPGPSVDDVQAKTKRRENDVPDGGKRRSSSRHNVRIDDVDGSATLRAGGDELGDGKESQDIYTVTSHLYQVSPHRHDASERELPALLDYGRCARRP